MSAVSYQPLAARMRPASLDEFVGQPHLLGPGRALRALLESQQLHSMILWGPPGVGKTSLAKLFARLVDADFCAISAVLSGVKEIRAALDQAQKNRQQFARQTLLFVDEVHRFNKSQQDAFLPHVEDGTLVFVGATTENPSFEVNNALLSRTRVYKLKSIETEALAELLQRALADPERGLGELPVEVEPGVLDKLAQLADGDARRALNLLEMAVDLAPVQARSAVLETSSFDGEINPVDGGESPAEGQRLLTSTVVSELLGEDLKRFDKGGDIFYEQISALHKAVRGSSPDAALYWLARMLQGGCDPLYVARRVVRMASEDIGNADPRALGVALEAWQVQERLGSPEGELAIAHAVCYMACAPKSNAVYTAFKQAMRAAQQAPDYEVPMHIRNAPTHLMKELGQGLGYRYAHDEPHGFAAGDNYFPEALQAERYYYPTERGLEKKIKEKLDFFQSLNETSSNQRYAEVEIEAYKDD